MQIGKKSIIGKSGIKVFKVKLEGVKRHKNKKSRKKAACLVHKAKLESDWMLTGSSNN